MVRCAHATSAELPQDALHAAAVVDRVIPRVLVLTGPTAVGKTQLSLALAEQLNGEVISADSVQVYKGLDIGSDKARLLCCERCQVWCQHLLDVLCRLPSRNGVVYLTTCLTFCPQMQSSLLAISMI